MIPVSVAMAAPASADSDTDAFLAAVSNAGIGPVGDPAEVIEMGKSVCSMLAEPGQTAADAAARVADTAGMPLGPATMFTGFAISLLCPAAVDTIGDRIPVLPLLGF